MDELTLLRSTRDLTREPSGEALARGHAALVSQIDAELPVTLFAHVGDDTAFAPLKTRRRRRTVAWAGFSVLGAASVVGALVAADVLGVVGWNGGADPAAASALRSAAAAAIQVSDPVVGAEQYLFVRTDGVFSGVGTLEEDADRIRAQGGEIQPSDDVAILVSTHDELYVPADRNDTWVWISCTSQPSQTFGPRSERYAEEYAEDMNTYDLDVIRQFPGGITPGGGHFGGYAEGTTTSIDYGALPREPRPLLDEIYELNGTSGQSRDGQALEWIISTLQWGIVPADFRAALYEAAAEIPGVEITDAQATLDGTTGIAIGRLETASYTRHEFIIDPETGQYIGERRVTLDGYAGMPPGTVTDWTAVTTSVVASAPTDAASCDG